MQITITVQDRIARCVGSPQIVCGNSDYIVAFECDSEWDAYQEKTAVFSFCRRGERITLTVPFTGYACYAPAITDADRVEIGCCAGNIRTSTPAVVPCCKCITDAPSAAYEPQTDIYNTIMEQLSVIGMPRLADDEYFVITAEGDYVVTAEGDYVIAKE